MTLHVGYTLIVGKPFPFDVPRDLDGACLSIDDDGIRLLLLMRSPSMFEIEAIHRTPFEARLRIGTHTLFFYFRCGHGSLWHEGCYSPWRGAAAGSRLYSEPAPNTGVMLKLCLVDSTTGILRSMRATFLGEGLSRAVLSACKDILAKPANDDEHMREVGEQAQIPLELAAAQAPLRFRTKDAGSGR